MEIKITMRCQLIPVRMAIIKKNTNNKWYQGCSKKGIFVHCWWECILVQSLCRDVSQKTKTELCDPEIPFLGVYPKKTKTLI